jgi:hypothetical protein
VIIIKKIVYSLIFVFLLTSIYASQETDWLVQEFKQRPRNIQETSLTLLALHKQLGTVSPLSTEIATLTNYLDTCTTANNCNNKDTAFATLTLSEIGDTSQSLEDGLNWLINSRTMFASDISGDWIIQIVSAVPGSCEIANGEIQQNETITNVQAGVTPWHTLSTGMVPPNTRNLLIDCSQLSQSNNLIISLINKKNLAGIDNFFIKEEVRNNNLVTVQLGIPCWGSTYRSTCDPDTTAHVLSSLNKQNRNPDPAWLEQQSPNALQKAFLFSITGNQTYLSDLESTQSPNGYWASPNILTTSLISSFLPTSSQAKNRSSSWLVSQEAPDGCWPRPNNLCNVESTAAVIYSESVTLTPSSSTTPSSTTQTEKTLLGDCDAPCLDEDGCTCVAECKRSTLVKGENCEGPEDSGSGDARIGEPCITEALCDGQLDTFGRCQDIPGDSCPSATNICNNNFICDPSEDCSCSDCDGLTCPSGQSGVCNFVSGRCESDTSALSGGNQITPPPSNAESKGSSTLFWFLLVIAALIALVGGSFLAYKKGLIKFKKSSSPKAAYKPQMKIPKEFKPEQYKPRTRPSAKKHPKVKKFLDNELDKSINELSKLLKD